MKIGDRVTYREDADLLGLDEFVGGTVVEPTEQELEEVRRRAVPIGPDHGDVMVEWDDGDRFWEQPSSLMPLAEKAS